MKVAMIAAVSAFLLFYGMVKLQAVYGFFSSSAQATETVEMEAVEVATASISSPVVIKISNDPIRDADQFVQSKAFSVGQTEIVATKLYKKKVEGPEITVAERTIPNVTITRSPYRAVKGKILPKQFYPELNKDELLGLLSDAKSDLPRSMQ